MMAAYYACTNLVTQLKLDFCGGLGAESQQYPAQSLFATQDVRSTPLQAI